jgi:hypothetical protein
LTSIARPMTPRSAANRVRQYRSLITAAAVASVISRRPACGVTPSVVKNRGVAAKTWRTGSGVLSTITAAEGSATVSAASL